MESAGWRTVIVNSHSKLSLCDDNLLVTGENHRNMVPLSQIRNVLINTGETSVTSRLISELNSRNIKMMFCDEKHLPCCEICGYSNNVNSAGRHYEQIAWSKKRKSAVWSKIIKHKIIMQSNVLEINSINGAGTMMEIADGVSSENAVVHEALAARLYFSLLFGDEFNRRTASEINNALNYGYSIILSDVSRAITLHGYLTSIGINHCSQRNPFNLSCDMMEPFRAYVDNFVYRTQPAELDWNYKKKLIELGSETVLYGNKKTELHTAIEMYVRDVLAELSEFCDEMKVPGFYEQI